MKQVFFLLIFTTFFSCKKDRTDSTTPNTPPSSTPVKGALTVYKNIPNSNNELIATYFDSAKSSTSYLYGSTNNEGRVTVAKSAVYKVNGNDTLINVILDAELRPSILYLSSSAGVKINQIFKLDYVTGDSIKVSFYKYNWLNNKDSLMAQYTTKNNGGNVLYGSRIYTTLNTIDALFTAAGVGMVVIAVLCPLAAGYIVGVALQGGPILQALTTLGVFILAVTNTAQAATLSTNIPNAPFSPTAINNSIPNPIGTPMYPSVLQIGNAYAGGLIFYFSDSAHQHGRVCATEDVGNYPWDLTIFDPQNPYSYNPPYVGGTSTSVVSGVSNTTRIIATLGSGNYAAYMCRSYRGNGYNDWSLPSKDELNLIYQNLKLKGLGSFGKWYQCSSEIDNRFIWYQRFDNGIFFGDTWKNNAYNVRATRGF